MIMMIVAAVGRIGSAFFVLGSGGGGDCVCMVYTMCVCVVGVKGGITGRCTIRGPCPRVFLLLEGAMMVFYHGRDKDKDDDVCCC
jgi:hypothetical protein